MDLLVNRRGSKGMLPRGRGLGITEEDFKKGLRYVKVKAKKRFRKLAKRLHPDTSKSYRCKGTKFLTICKSYNRIMNMKTVPVTWENINALMEITKGYKTREDFPEIFN